MSPHPITSGSATAQVLPVHYELTRSQRLFAIAAITGAVLLLTMFVRHVGTHIEVWRWWVPVSFVAGLIAADFASGLVHWAADTWGRDDLAWVGPRLLVPFRVHHVNPQDFTRRSFAAANGEVAAIACPVLAAFFAVPPNSAWGGPVMVFGVSFCALGLVTNQIHQWAHATPPRAVRWLQRAGLLLRPADHARHHDNPYDREYCIATGWCNRPLERVGFFRRLETVVTIVTGARPRDDDRRYLRRFGSADLPRDATHG